MNPCYTKDAEDECRAFFKRTTRIDVLGVENFAPDMDMAIARAMNIVTDLEA